MGGIIGNRAMLDRFRSWVKTAIPDLFPDDGELLLMQETAEKVAASFGAIPQYRQRPADITPVEPPCDFIKDQHIRRLFAWVSRDGNGIEGIIIGEGLPGLGWTPLVSGNLKVAKLMEDHALDVQRRAIEEGNPISISLRRYVMGDEP
jgi:hypothetical protein